MRVKEGKINLLPKQYRNSRRIKILGYSAIGILMLEVIGFISLVVLPVQRELKITNDELLSKQKGAEDERYVRINELLEATVIAQKELQSWITCCKNIEKETFIGGRLLDELTARIPEGLILSSISIEEGTLEEESQNIQQISLSGRAQAPTQVMTYLNTMETLFLEDTISHTLTKDSQTEESIFEFNIELKESADLQEEPKEYGNSEQVSIETMIKGAEEVADAGQ